MIGRKNWQGFAASFWLLAPSAVAAQEIHKSERIEPTVVHLAPRDPAQPVNPASNALTVTSTAAGHVRVWATSTDFEPALRVEDAFGTDLGKDGDSGGKHTPYLSIAVERDATLRVIVNCAKPDAHGNALLYVAEMSETEETLAEAQALRDALDESLRAKHEKNYGDSREMLREGVEHALSIAGGERSEALQDALYAVGTEFGSRDENETSLRVNRALYDWFTATRPLTAHDLQVVRLRLAQDLLEASDSVHGLALAEAALSCILESLPEDHHDVQVARAIVSRLLIATGDVERGADLCRKVIDVDRRTLA